MMPPPRSTRLAALLLLGSLGQSCDKVPLFAPTGSSITLSADKLVAPLNSDVRITAVVQESAGTPPQNGTTVNFSSNLGTFEPAETQTVGGRVTVTFHTGGTSGVATIAATSGAAKADTGTGALKITIGAAATKTVQVSASPSSVKASGGTVTIAASALDESGNRLASVPMSFTTDAGTLSASSAVSDATGIASVQLTTNVAATVTATAGGQSATAKVTIAKSPSVTLTVATTSPSPTAGAPFSFTVTPLNPEVAPSVSLDFGDGTKQDLGTLTAARTVTHTYAAQGSYTITADSRDTNNGDTASTTLGVTVGARPVATVTLKVDTDSPAVSLPTKFTITPTVGTGALPMQNVRFAAGDDYAVDLGAITSATTVMHTYTTAGTFQARATVTDTGGFSTSATQFVTVSQTMVILTSDKNPSTTADTVKFTVSGLPTAGVDRVEWEFGSDGTATTRGSTTALHKFSSAASYTVKATAYATSGTGAPIGTGQLVQIVNNP